MKIFSFNFKKKDNKTQNNKNYDLKSDQYSEIGKLVKEARIQSNFSIKYLSDVSKIPEPTLRAIENNIKDHRPKYPFIRSILLKLEKCLSLKKNTLLGLVNEEKNTFKKIKKNYIVRKFDFINSWKGSVLYFLFLIFALFILNRYFMSNVEIIEIQIIEEKQAIN